MTKEELMTAIEYCLSEDSTCEDCTICPFYREDGDCRYGAMMAFKKYLLEEHNYETLDR